MPNVSRGSAVFAWEQRYSGEIVEAFPVSHEIQECASARDLDRIHAGELRKVLVGELQHLFAVPGLLEMRDQLAPDPPAVCDRLCAHNVPQGGGAFAARRAVLVEHRLVRLASASVQERIRLPAVAEVRLQHGEQIPELPVSIHLHRPFKSPSQTLAIGLSPASSKKRRASSASPVSAYQQPISRYVCAGSSQVT